MTWDKTKPQGSEALRLGDDRIRELKQDLENIITYEHYFELDQNNNIVDVQHKLPIGFPTTDKLDGRLCYVPDDETLYMWDGVENQFKRLAIPDNLIPVGTRIVGKISAPCWVLISLGQTYCVRLTNAYNDAGLTGGTDDPNYMFHQHSVSEYRYSHSHSISDYTRGASGEQCDTYGGDKGTWSASDHRHSFSLTLSSQELAHSHSMDSQGGSISTGYLGVYERQF
jgi:hypothetical protein